MKIRYRCTRKGWHVTHPIEVDDGEDSIEDPIRCLFCGADMRLEIIGK